MSGQLTASIPSFDTAVTDFSQTRQFLAGVLAELRDGLATLAGMEGNDQYGALFRQAYDPQSQFVCDATRQCLPGIEAIVNRAAGKKVDFLSADETAKQGFCVIVPDLDGDGVMGQPHASDRQVRG
jgi:hypothetical protein